MVLDDHPCVTPTQLYGRLSESGRQVSEAVHRLYFQLDAYKHALGKYQEFQKRVESLTSDMEAAHIDDKTADPNAMEVTDSGSSA